MFRRNESGGWDKQTWVYQYDALDRRIRKGRLKEDGGLEDETRFVWDGSRLLQEVYARGRYTYVYADQDSYEPLAQIHNYTNAGFETYQEINYFHCDQIGIPREMTDKDGRLLWFGDYDGWGRLKEETNITGAHQPFRLQNQYCDAETGLHYNFYRYYEPNSGRFVNQDPIGLWGGDNLYAFAPNAQNWIDPSGNIAFVPILIAMGVGALTGAATDAGMQVASNVINGKDWNDIDYGSVALGAGIGAIAGPVLGKVGKLAIGKCRNAFGPFRNWYRRKPSYSRSGGFRTNNSISWGASPARNGRYVNQIGNPKSRQFNQYIRNKRLPPGRLWWRTRDPGHFHIKR